ncbi:conjugal transfer protein TraO [Porphyromonas levii]|uniref:conjugal transfer protein TraO n=1 Tax=Porphyromonas levii TaxID=28114 RepID=UPI000A079B69|nr:conjugal transfer protein TraO [Porphyromonas levii]
MMSRFLKIFRAGVVVLLLLVSSNSLHAQRLIPKQSGVAVLVGTPGISQSGIFEPNAYNVSFEITQYLKKATYWFAGAEYRQRDSSYSHYTVPVQEYLLNGGYMYPVLVDPRKTVLIYAGLSATAGYQELNKGERTMPNGATLVDRSRFVYGATPQISLETLLTDNFIVTLRGKGMFLWGSDLQLFYPSLSAGVKINF